ncbi:glycosyltransferase family 2 protein, partial [Acidithiobacillus ferriphilus]|uniref:glycosyltransferase family 2 protein n=1 Tax=Acidithiobacillus ferriphilus TaxID=1689834 RepID=UPI002DBBA775
MFNPIKQGASILIPVFNRSDELMCMLDSYTSQDVSDLICEIIIIDDASTDGCVESVIKSFVDSCQTKVITMSNAINQGFARSVNTASRASKGDVLVVCNSDIVFKKNALANLLARFDDKILGAAGCLHLRYSDKSLDHAGVVVSREAKIIHDKTMTLDSGDWAFSGALFAVRGALFKSLGGFDEQFINGGEDVDLCIRIRKSGFKIDVVKECIIEHHVGASRGVNVARDEVNSFSLYKKWKEDIRASCEISWKRELHCISQIESVMGFGIENKGDLNSVVSFLSKNYVEREMDRWRRMFDGQTAAINLLY